MQRTAKPGDRVTLQRDGWPVIYWYLGQNGEGQNLLQPYEAYDMQLRRFRALPPSPAEAFDAAIRLIPLHRSDTGNVISLRQEQTIKLVDDPADSVRMAAVFVVLFVIAMAVMMISSTPSAYPLPVVVADLEANK